MKSKFTLFLLFLLLASFSMQAQVVDDTIRSLVITEAMTFNSSVPRSYVELTNMGAEPVDLSNFELGSNAWTTCHTFQSPPANKIMLPNILLQPGETYVIANVRDYAEKRLDLTTLPRTWPIIWKKVDLAVHKDEAEAGTNGGQDSISIYDDALPTGGGWAIYLEHHVGGDSTVVDGVFLNIDPVADRIFSEDLEARGVAGYPEAWGGGNVLVRKANVNKGNFNWDDSRGSNPEESEWMVIPERGYTGSGTARFFTTLGHHGDVTLNNSSVSSTKITIDWANSKMMVPWGIYRDSIMDEFNLTGGIGWHYHLSPTIEDSTHTIVVTGDTLTMYAAGNSLHQINFALEQMAPAQDMNLVFPKNQPIIDDNEIVGWFTHFYVTENQPGMDSVGSIGFRTRVDTLFKYLDKASNATWEIDWIDEVARPDVKRGDILKVTAANGAVKNYFLAVDSIPEPSHNANLSAITWPDAPDFLRQNPAWHDDTIPGFNVLKFLYNVELPYGTTNVPALKAIPANLNAKVVVERAILLSGTVNDRTSTITVTAEDDTTVHTYSVTFTVEKLPEMIQPFAPDPFISEIVRKAWRQNCFIEITNPGNRPLDLSNYMIVTGWPGQDPVAIFTSQGSTYAKRFTAYVPGYNYQSSIEWGVTPDLIEKDLTVNPIVAPGESFVFGSIASGSGGWIYNNVCDAIWTSQATLVDDPVAGSTTETRVWHNGYDAFQFNTSIAFLAPIAGKATTVSLYKILNDSIKNGEKGLGDLNDFKLIDVWGTYDGAEWAPGGTTLSGVHNWYFRRKPQFWEGDTLPGINGSWGATDEESEWAYKDWNIIAAELSLSGPYAAEPYLPENIGTHALDAITLYLSTVSSYVYKVSDGYKTPQTIKGVPATSKVSDLLAHINKNDAGQSLEVIGKGSSDGIVDSDTLMVSSADGKNVTKYVITTGELDGNATLTSSKYTISIDGNTGTISGIPVGTSIKDVRTNVTKPQKAMLNIIDGDNNLVPVQVRNFDSLYVNTGATNDIYFEVIAENGTTKILYQLNLNVSQSDAYLFSDVFTVDQQLQMVSLVPGGIRTGEFFKNLKTNEGASMKLYDKTGLEITAGNVAYDDIVIVTSPDGTTTKVYSLTFLNEAEGTDAYVVSDIFEVDQLERIISEIQPGLSLGVFYNLVRTAPGASMMIIDSEGNEKTSGVVTMADHLKVVSGDGQLTVSYELKTITTGLPSGVMPKLKVYPNPASDRLYIEGISGSSEIEVSNILGSVVKMLKVTNVDRVAIEMGDMTPGIYFISVRTMDNRQYEIFRVIKQ